ncbi:RNA polymerase sigma-70 factor [Pedobacter hiemivivus]|uniref:RNA polymerase sigma-70 factor n=1 Tax=Pedobacter hiemivivus TaxID=2530454 RepID=A0A4R0MNK7_9SPHI|nr:RNA polymerase sigma-70 factor [Pedobacter hiemivivus]TCC88355.1 RNA polymerase sigma-70 factor [Pedobacter hiemivivus]TKC59950.1 RNA polymerase sigma-70 factor [Pedobacter hiemivivus]
MFTDQSDIPENHTLLTKLRNGDELAFAQIYNQYRSKMYLYAYNLCKSSETAEEIVQEVFIRLWQKKEQINTDLNFSAYLKKITLNHVLNHLKKVAREKSLQDEIFHYIETIRNTTEDNLLEKELLKTYDEAIENLPPQKKIIYQMSRNEEMSHDEIAEKLNISKNTVKNHMVEATKFIRSYVNKHGSIVCFIIASSNYFRPH